MESAHGARMALGNTTAELHMTMDGFIVTVTSTRHDRATPSALACGAVATDHDVERLRTRLRSVVVTHGLKRRDLLDIQRGIVKLEGSSQAPTRHGFWATTALPRAQTMASEAKQVIDEEVAMLIARVGFGPSCALATEDPLARLEAVLPRGSDLDRLGRWWQRRLRRHAIRRALPNILLTPAGEVGFVVARTELELLDRPPWAHGDRLLSAFELAYAEIERHGTAQISLARHKIELAGQGRLAIRL